MLTEVCFVLLRKCSFIEMQCHKKRNTVPKIYLTSAKTKDILTYVFDFYIFENFNGIVVSFK